MFYGENVTSLKLDGFQLDAKPREVFITVCLIIPIIAIGLYPKLATESYDLKTVQVASKTRASLEVIVNHSVENIPANFTIAEINN